MNVATPAPNTNIPGKATSKTNDLAFIFLIAKPGKCKSEMGEVEVSATILCGYFKLRRRVRTLM